MPTEVIDISDTSDTGPVNDYGYTSDDSEIVVVSVSSPAPQPPSSSQPRSDLRGDVSGIWDPSGSEDDGDPEVDSLDAAGLVSASKSQRAAGRRSGVASGSQQSQTRNSISTSPESRKQKGYAYSSDSEDGLVVEPSKKPTKRRKKKTEEEKALEKAEKEAKKLAKQEETRRKKQATAAEKAAEKLAKKAHKDANKLVSNKKTTLTDMTIELSHSLLTSPLHALLCEKMQEFGCALVPIADGDATVRNLTNHETNLNTLGVKLIRWKRRVRATYNEHSRQWQPLEQEEQYTRTEGTYLIFVARGDVLSRPSFVEQVSSIREALGPKHHLHLMLCGWKPSRKDEREAVERELVRLQVRENVFVEQVPDEDEAVNWIYNITADLGIKPYKLIERSHLPFCAVASSSMKVGTSDADTMARMLTQLPRLADPAAQAVVREYGTINRIMEAYSKAEVEHSGTGPIMLADVELNVTKKGKKTSLVLNNALSERIYALMWGNDPKALMN